MSEPTVSDRLEAKIDQARNNAIDEVAEGIVKKFVATYKGEKTLASYLGGPDDLRGAIASAIRAERERADSDLNAGRELMRQAWHEFNAIRARDGAPIGVSPEWWDEMTERLGSLLGSDTVPWMTGAAKALLAPERARAEAAEAERDRLRDGYLELVAAMTEALDAFIGGDLTPPDADLISAAKAIRAEWDKLREALAQIEKERDYYAAMDYDFEAERSIRAVLEDALERIMTNEVRAHHDFRIDACHIAREALARAKGESDG